jgi:hypothetical protein
MYGQEIMEYKYDVGINITSMIAKVISVADDRDIDNSYLLNLRIKNNKHGIRTGFFIDYTNSVSFSSTSLEVLSTKARMGYERYYQINKKFILGYGFDILGNYSNSISDNEVFKNKIKTLTFGLGPVMKFEYFLSSRLSISTETSLYGIYGKQKSSLFENDVIVLISNNSVSSISSTLPSILFVNIHF